MKGIERFNIILASGSPRRQQFLKDLNIPFEVKLKSIEEDFPETLYKAEIPEYLAKLKADAYNDLNTRDIVITGDTIVWHRNKALNKPEDREEAFKMISSLQGSWHEVISAFCIKTADRHIVKSDRTEVYFEPIAEEDIWHYIDTYKPFDKAGAYGIQEWIGQVGISKIKGSYFTVMGFPTHLFYQNLKQLINE